MAIDGANQYAGTMTNPEPRWANLKETAEHLRLHPRTIQRLAAAGTIIAHRVDGTTRYDLNQADTILRPVGMRAATMDELREAAQTDAEPTAADVIARIRAALPPGTGRPLIPLAHVHAAIDKVAAELGVEQ